MRVQHVGTGPDVLFVHRGSASGANWAPIVPQLVGFRCVLLDRPGCGLSAPAGVDHTPTMRNETNGPRELLRPGDGVLPASVLGAVRCPVRFAWGTADPLGGTDVAERFIERFPDAELERFPGASHAPWIDDPRRAAACVADILGP